MKQWLLLTLIATLFMLSCQRDEDAADAYGNFESDSQLVNAEMQGKILELNIEEGIVLKKGQKVGQLDTTQLHLNKLQVEASIKAIKAKLQDPGPQIRLIEKKMSVMDKEKARVEALIIGEAGTQKQLDDIQGQLDILQQQIETTRDQTNLANRALLGQIAPLKSQILQIEDQIQRAAIYNPIDGRVLLKLSEVDELASPLKALYKIANTSEMYLRAYVSGEQLPYISLGQKVRVEIDLDKDQNQSLEGEVSWISENAEFTPKTIQTKEERVNLVYAVKVRVENSEGKLKIGMPGELHFIKSPQENQAE